MPVSDGQSYSDDEVRAIIERALASTSARGGLSHGDLLAVGEQVGLSAEAMTRAAEEVRAAQLDSAATRAITSRRRRWLAAHAGLFALINGLLFSVNFLTTPGQWWSLFPIVFWGLALALHAGVTLMLPISTRAMRREHSRIVDAESAATRRLRVAAPGTTPEEPSSVDAHTDQDRTTRRA